jgi:hypothetical protein
MTQFSASDLAELETHFDVFVITKTWMIYTNAQEVKMYRICMANYWKYVVQNINYIWTQKSEFCWSGGARKTRHKDTDNFLLSR